MIKMRPLSHVNKLSALTRDDLRNYFLQGIKKPSQFKVGIEWEKLGIHRQTGKAISYKGTVGVQAIFKGLIQRYHWEPIFSSKGEPIALKRGNMSLTLEPGGQIELSGQKASNIGDNALELRLHLDEIRAVSEPLGVVWLGLGAQPLSTQKTMPWVPKDRYFIMRKVLRGRGTQTYSMMKETASIQVSLDFSSEQDALQKFRLAMSLSPYLTAAFANSFVVGGRRSKFLSRRADIWHHTDPARTGILWRALQAGFSLDDYIDYALHVPMFFLQREGRWIVVRNTNFKTYMQKGWRGLRATADDWALHLTTLFTEARIKRYIEIRSIDCQTPNLGLAVAAFLKTLFYEKSALNKSLDALGRIPIPDHMEIYYQAPTKALKSSSGDVSAHDVMRKLYRIATQAATTEDRQYMAPMKRIVDTGCSPAEQFISQYGVNRNRNKLIADIVRTYAL